MTALLLCTAILIVTLTVSGIAKAKDPSSTVEGILNLGLDRVAPLKFTAAVLPWAEIVLAAGLLLAPGPFFAVFAAAAAVLMATYLVVIARALGTGRTEGCNCFGKKSTAPVSRYTLIRNIGLTAAGVLTLVASLTGGQALLYEVLHIDGSGWLWVTGAGLIALTLWAVQRGDALAEPVPNIPEVIVPTPAAQDDSDDYIRMPIPYASIYTPDGRVTTLRDIAKVQARVLFFVSPTCGSCTPILKTMPTWQKLLPQIGLHPVFSTEEKIRQAEKMGKIGEGIQPLVDRKYTAMHNFGRGTPLTVILGSDGLLAGGPVAGTTDVKQLMDDLLVQFGAVKDPNAQHQTANTRPARTAQPAQPVRSPAQATNAADAPAAQVAVPRTQQHTAQAAGHSAPAARLSHAAQQPTHKGQDEVATAPVSAVAAAQDQNQGTSQTTGSPAQPLSSTQTQKAPHTGGAASGAQPVKPQEKASYRPSMRQQKVRTKQQATASIPQVSATTGAITLTREVRNSAPSQGSKAQRKRHIPGSIAFKHGARPDVGGQLSTAAASLPVSRPSTRAARARLSKGSASRRFVQKWAVKK